jgi:hypothetical protein
VAFGQETSTFYHENIELPFYNCLLKERCDKPLAEAWVFETGANKWHGLDAWPPKGVTATAFHLGEKGHLSKSAPPSGAFAEYVSDPAHPGPYYGAAITRGYAHEYMNADQRFAWSRPDVASWETEPLDGDVTIAGPILARLVVSTSGTDADWVVKLIDVWPEDAPAPDPNPRGVVMAGYQEMVRAEVMRGKFRNQLREAGGVRPRKGDASQLHPAGRLSYLPERAPDHGAGADSWFPLVDRNPQQFSWDIYHREGRRFQEGNATGIRDLFDHPSDMGQELSCENRDTSNAPGRLPAHGSASWSYCPGYGYHLVFARNYTRRDGDDSHAGWVRCSPLSIRVARQQPEVAILLSRDVAIRQPMAFLRILTVPGPCLCAREGFIFVYQDVRGRFQSDRRVRAGPPVQSAN